MGRVTGPDRRPGRGARVALAALLVVLPLSACNARRDAEGGLAASPPLLSQLAQSAPAAPAVPAASAGGAPGAPGAPELTLAERILARGLVPQPQRLEDEAIAAVIRDFQREMRLRTQRPHPETGRAEPATIAALAAIEACLGRMGTSNGAWPPMGCVRIALWPRTAPAQLARTPQATALYYPPAATPADALPSAAGAAAAPLADPQPVAPVAPVLQVPLDPAPTPAAPAAAAMPQAPPALALVPPSADPGQAQEAAGPVPIAPAGDLRAPPVGAPARIIEHVDCQANDEAWVLFYEGEAVAEAGETMTVTVRSRHSLRFDPARQGISDQDWFCAPKRRYCHSQVSFDSWRGTLGPGAALTRPRDRVFRQVGLEIPSMACHVIRQACAIQGLRC